MSEIIALAAEPRSRAGKGVARQTRRAGKVPAVIYGNKEEPLLIALEFHAFKRHLHTKGFFTHVFDITVDGKSHRVLPRDVQFNPVTDAPEHVDFLRVPSGSSVVVQIPCEFVNAEKSPGLKRGGVLNIVRHEIEVECASAEIPDNIVVDLTGYDLGDSVHISAVKLPSNVKTTITDRDFTVATIVAPSGLKSEAAEEAAAEAAGEQS
jgi:large subunit ribosomal protein L25